jgi:hypothetical protein
MQNPRHTPGIRNELIKIPLVQFERKRKDPQQFPTKRHAVPEIAQIRRLESREDIVVGPLVPAVKFKGVGREFILRWRF